MTDLERAMEPDAQSDVGQQISAAAARNSEALSQFSDRIFAVAQASAVFSAPVTAGDYTVITASEVMAGGGFGSGFGVTPPTQAGETEAAPASRRPAGSGGGGGGGGGARARPVAAIVIGPRGVTVRPLFDATQIGLAALATVGAMAAFRRRLRRGRAR